MVVHAFNPSTKEAQAGRSVWVWGQLILHSKFHDSQGYLVRCCFKATTTTTKKKIQESLKLLSSKIKTQTKPKPKPHNKRQTHNTTSGLEILLAQLRFTLFYLFYPFLPLKLCMALATGWVSGAPSRGETRTLLSHSGGGRKYSGELSPLSQESFTRKLPGKCIYETAQMKMHLRARRGAPTPCTQEAEAMQILLDSKIV